MKINKYFNVFNNLTFSLEIMLIFCYDLVNIPS